MYITGSKTENSWEAKSKVDKLKKALEADFDSIQKLFENKEFIEELRSFDTTGLSEDEKKMVEVILSDYVDVKDKANDALQAGKSIFGDQEESIMDKIRKLIPELDED